MKIIDERETQKQKTKPEKKKGGGAEAIVKRWELNGLVVHLS